MPAGVTVFPMKKTENSAWYLCRAREQVADGRCDEIGRLLHRTNAEIDLMAILERSEEEAIRALAGSALISVPGGYVLSDAARQDLLLSAGALVTSSPCRETAGFPLLVFQGAPAEPGAPPAEGRDGRGHGRSAEPDSRRELALLQ